MIFSFVNCCRFSLSLVALFCIAVAAKADALFDKKVDQMTDMILPIMPSTRVLPEALASRPSWPLDRKYIDGNSPQLACVRSALSTPGVRKRKRQEVKAYAEADTARFDAEYELLDSGVSKIIASLYAAMPIDDRPAAPWDWSKFPPEQGRKVLLFAKGTEYDALRALAESEWLQAREFANPNNDHVGNSSLVASVRKAVYLALDSCGVSRLMLDEYVRLDMDPLQVNEELAAKSIKSFPAKCNDNRVTAETRFARNELTPAVVHPSYGLPLPAYPPTSQQAGEEGVAHIEVFVTELGTISKARLLHSSGFASLDKATLEHVQSWHLTPGRYRGQATCSWMMIPVKFKLPEKNRKVSQ